MTKNLFRLFAKFIRLIRKHDRLIKAKEIFTKNRCPFVIVLFDVVFVVVELRLCVDDDDR